MSRRDIFEQAKMLKIPFLLHFTRADNLPHIIEHGLYPVDRMHEIGAAPIINDHLRLDGHLDGLSLSIAFPNSRMFYKCRKAQEDTEWVVLAVRASVLWEKKCVFCQHNAADKRISSQSPERLAELDAFQRMYEEIEGMDSREDQRLRPYDPTDVQAEVLVFDKIDPKLIVGAAFNSKGALNRRIDILGERKSVVQSDKKGFFGDRGYVRKYFG